MARVERSKERKRHPDTEDSSEGYSEYKKGRSDSGRGSRGPKSRYNNGRRSRSDSDRGSRSDSGRSRGFKNRRDIEMTKVICSSCGESCEVPFKPTSSKPVFCSSCFEREGKGSSNRHSSGPSSRDLDIINEKLNKIMAALKIEE